MSQKSKRSVCFIFGGSGFVGTHLASRLLASGRFDRIYLADIRPTRLALEEKVVYSNTDVRRPIPLSLISADEQVDWIFNLAAIHREPGHAADEYFETNLTGAENVCRFAEESGCDNIFFTSSISVYGPTKGATDENSPIRPISPYGSSKYPAELIHHVWRNAASGRRLIISRPGVLYGPGDPGNMLRMIKAIQKGYFAFPGSPRITKSYGYIHGFLDSIEFTMSRPEPQITYNYVEHPTQPLNEIVELTKKFLNSNAKVLPVPLWVLLPIARVMQSIKGSNTPIHPVRVRKAATPTHIVPRTLLSMGFDFKYDFMTSLKHWAQETPQDFGMLDVSQSSVVRKVTLRRHPEEMVPTTQEREYVEQ